MICAQQKKRPPIINAEKMDIRLKQAPEPIGRAPHKQTYGIALLSIFYVKFPKRLRMPHALDPIHKRPEMHALIRHKLQTLRRSKRIGNLPMIERIRRQKLAKHSHHIKRDNNHTRSHCQVVLAKLPPHQLPLRRGIGFCFPGLNILLDRLFSSGHSHLMLSLFVANARIEPQQQNV